MDDVQPPLEYATASDVLHLERDGGRLLITYSRPGVQWRDVIVPACAALFLVYLCLQFIGPEVRSVGSLLQVLLNPVVLLLVLIATLFTLILVSPSIRMVETLLTRSPLMILVQHDASGRPSTIGWRLGKATKSWQASWIASAEAEASQWFIGKGRARLVLQFTPTYRHELNLHDPARATLRSLYHPENTTGALSDAVAVPVTLPRTVALQLATTINASLRGENPFEAEDDSTSTEAVD